MKRLNYVFLAIDIMFVVGVIIVSLSPSILGKKFLDKVGLKVAYTAIDHKISLEKISDSLYVETTEYKRSDNYYEEVIINHDSSKPYKLVELTIDDYRAFMLIVYNPANVKMMVGNGFKTPNNTGKMTIADMTKKYGAVAGINGGGFFDNGEYATDEPKGYIIENGKIVWDEPNRIGNLIGFNNDNKLVLIQATGEEAINMGIRDALEFGPFLMCDGVVTQDALRMGEARASRVIIAQRSDGVVLMLATDGGSFVGPRMSEIMKALSYYGAYNAANLDGGLSSQMVVEGKNYTTVTDKLGNVVTVGRRVINGFGVFED